MSNNLHYQRLPQQSQVNNDDNIIDLSSIQRRKVPETNPIEKKPMNNITDNLNYPSDFEKNIPIVKKRAKKVPIKNSIDKVDDKDPDSQNSRAKLLCLIQFYLLTFPEKLSAFKGMKYQKMKLEELTEIRNQMDIVLSSKSGIQQSEAMIISGIRMLEAATVYTTPIKCEGLASCIVSDQEAIDDIKHIALKRMSLVPSSPELRLAYKVASTMLILHGVNSKDPGKPAIQQSDNETYQPIDKLGDINNKFNDI